MCFTSFSLGIQLNAECGIWFRRLDPPSGQRIFKFAGLGLVCAGAPFVLLALAIVAGIQRRQFRKLRACSKDQSFLFHGLPHAGRLRRAPDARATE